MAEGGISVIRPRQDDIVEIFVRTKSGASGSVRTAQGIMSAFRSNPWPGLVAKADQITVLLRVFRECICDSQSQAKRPVQSDMMSLLTIISVSND